MCVCVIILIVIELDAFHLCTPSPVSDMEFTYCNFHRISLSKNSQHGRKGPCSKNDRMRMRLCLPCNEIGPFRKMTHHIGCENLLTLDDLYCFLPMIEKCYLKHSKIQFLFFIIQEIIIDLIPPPLSENHSTTPKVDNNMRGGEEGSNVVCRELRHGKMQFLLFSPHKKLTLIQTPNQ